MTIKLLLLKSGEDLIADVQEMVVKENVVVGVGLMIILVRGFLQLLGLIILLVGLLEQVIVCIAGFVLAAVVLEGVLGKDYFVALLLVLFGICLYGILNLNLQIKYYCRYQ